MKGYDVVHNVKRVGTSGAEHQIDILAEYRCPLHTSQVIIEAKFYDAPVDKDRVMKLIQIVDDLGVDRGILVTTSYFTPGAIKSAKGHRVDLWDRKRLVELLGEVEISALEKGLPKKVEVLEQMILPRLSISEARKIIQELLNKRARGGFLGIGKVEEELEEVSMLYYPYYEADLQAVVIEEQKIGVFKKRKVQKIVTTRVNVDALTGELVTVDENGISYIYGYLSKLNEEEISIIRSYERFTIAELTGLGYSPYKARKVASSLASKGIVRAYKPRHGPTIYKLQVSFPRNPQMLRSISSTYITKEKKKGNVQFYAPSQDPSAVIKALESYWVKAKVKNLYVIYYPYFTYVLTTKDGSKRVEMLDALTGKVNERFS